MMNISLKDARALAGFIRNYLDVLRESTALKAILEYSAQHNVCPSDWKDSLKALKTAPQYNEPGKEIESVIVRFEQDADETELLAQLQKMTQEPIN